MTDAWHLRRVVPRRRAPNLSVCVSANLPGDTNGVGELLPAVEKNDGVLRSVCVSTL